MRRRTVLTGIATAAAGLVIMAPGRSSAAATKVATVAGPVSGGRRGKAFGFYPGDLGAFGYIEEEYFISGEATRYKPVGELTQDGKWTIEPAGTAPYKTRILVRRPRDPAKFNGTVLVDWLNVSLGFDIGLATDGLYRDGFAVVGVSAQSVGVNGFPQNPRGLKAWDPDRYASLAHPGDSASYDIFTQAARALGPGRPKGGTDPMGGLRVRKLIATGASQSAARLLSYANAIQSRDNVFDAIAATVGSGFATGFDDMILNPSGAPADLARTFRARAQFRDDLAVPVMLINSESETANYYPLRQPDTGKFRYWEVAGASHFSGSMVRDLGAVAKIYGLNLQIASSGAPSEIDWLPAAEAAYYHLHTMLNGGPLPPIQPRIEINPSPPVQIVRDSLGIAVGGIRLPGVQAPTARNSGAAVVAGMGGLTGESQPLAADTLKKLYPTKAAYVAKVTSGTRKAQQAGFIRPYRAQEFIAAAKTTKI